MWRGIYRGNLQDPEGTLQRTSQGAFPYIGAQTAHQQENESIADLHTRITLLLEKCNYNQYCMNTCKVQLFVHEIKFFIVCSLGREQLADLGYDRLLDKAESHETAMAEYHLDNKSRQDSMAFPAMFSTSIDAVYFLCSISSTAWNCCKVI